MNCVTARRQLLGSDRPDQPGASLSAHLAGCPACRAVQRRLVRLEQDIPLLAVPLSRPPAALLERVLCVPVLVKSPTRLGPPRDTKEGARQKLALAFALAASLAVFTVGWWAWPRPDHHIESPGPTVYHEQLTRKLQGARGPGEAVERMTDLAEEWFAKADAADPEHLRVMARHFDRLMRRDLPHHAGQIPLAARAAGLDKVKQRLQGLESHATRLAAARKATGDHTAAGSLAQIAAAVLYAKKSI